MLKLMYISNDVNIVKAAEKAGVDRIFLDLEILDKEKRQAGRNTVISKHTVEDVKNIREVVNSSELLVRINPINPNSPEEINSIIACGADIIMLPMFKTAEEVKTFINLVNGRCKTILLLEHIDAVNVLDEILEIKGIEEFHIGLNDLHISTKNKFMFELLSDGTVDSIVKKIKGKGYPVGIGGMSKLGTGMLSADLILSEHYRLKSSGVILSRGFIEGFDPEKDGSYEAYFKTHVDEIRKREVWLLEQNEEYFDSSRQELKRIVDVIIEKMNNN